MKGSGRRIEPCGSAPTTLRKTDSIVLSSMTYRLISMHGVNIWKNLHATHTFPI